MKSVLLVGGAGYVGTVLAWELLERGYDVKILDRLYFGKIGLRDSPLPRQTRSLFSGP